MNGLDITEEQFMKMQSKERDLVIFRNMVYIRQQFGSYRFHRKIQYVWLIGLSILFGIKRFLLGG